MYRVVQVTLLSGKQSNQVMSHIQTRDSLSQEKAQSPLLPFGKPIFPRSGDSIDWERDSLNSKAEGYTWCLTFSTYWAPGYGGPWTKPAYEGLNCRMWAEVLLSSQPKPRRGS